jgi:hypothetical protein
VQSDLHVLATALEGHAKFGQNRWRVTVLRLRAVPELSILVARITSKVEAVMQPFEPRNKQPLLTCSSPIKAAGAAPRQDQQRRQGCCCLPINPFCKSHTPCPAHLWFEEMCRCLTRSAKEAPLVGDVSRLFEERTLNTMLKRCSSGSVRASLLWGGILYSRQRSESGGETSPFAFAFLGNKAKSVIQCCPDAQNKDVTCRGVSIGYPEIHPRCRNQR